MSTEKSQTILSRSELDTFKAGYELGKKVLGKTIIGLNGELGAGKTVFVKGLADALEVKELINSPTFLGINESYSGKFPLIHMDFYMKVQKEELVRSYLKSDAVIAIEWIKNFNEIFKSDLNPNINVFIEYMRDKENNIIDNERQIKIEWL